MFTEVEVEGFGKGGEQRVSFANTYNLDEEIRQKSDILQQLRKLGDNLNKYKENFGEQSDQIIGNYVRDFQYYYNITIINTPILALAIVLYHNYSSTYKPEFLYDPYIQTKLTQIMIDLQDNPSNTLLLAKYQADLARYWLIVINFKT